MPVEGSDTSAISTTEWDELHRAFLEDLGLMPEPRDEREQELSRELEELAQFLKDKPDAKNALSKIAF